MSLTLRTPPALHRSAKILVAAGYAKQSITVVTDASPDAMKSASVWGKVPVLDTPEGSLSESNAVARYVARLAPECKLYGESLFESAQIDSWMDWCTQELEIPASMWVAPVLGWMANNPAVTKRAQADLRKALSALEKHLKAETFLVGRHVTLADVTVATTLLYPFKLVMDAKARKPFPSVMRWFMTCVHQPEFAAVVGSVALCVKPLQAPKAAPAAAGGKKQKAKKEKKAGAGDKRGKDGAKKEAKPAAAKPAKKLKHPLEGLPKPKFQIDEWKRMYSNATDYQAVVDKFFTMMEDSNEGDYSLWFNAYKHDDENTTAFMTSNLVGGFMQRCDEVRKYAFGCIQVLQDDGDPNQRIRGCWLIRGDDIKHLLDCNPDAEYHEWTKVDLGSQDHRKAVKSIWCDWEKIYVAVPEGKEIKGLDSKVFK